MIPQHAPHGVRSYAPGSRLWRPLSFALGFLSLLAAGVTAQDETTPSPDSASLESVAPTLAAEAQNGAPLVPPAGTPGGPIYRIPVTGVIEMGLAPFIERGIEEALAAGASAVILDIDTPGGRVDSAERIADAVNDSPIPVYAFVNRRAISAGALISLASHGI